jgi:hypothetical protein
MTAGDGFGVMIIHIFNYFWIIIGTLTAFVLTVVNHRKVAKNKQCGQGEQI